jgi:hypothetical protein
MWIYLEQAILFRVFWGSGAISVRGGLPVIRDTSQSIVPRQECGEEAEISTC